MASGKPDGHIAPKGNLSTWRGSDLARGSGTLLEDEPIVVSLSSALGCWKEGMLMMRVGGRSRLACPAALTYGDRDGPLGTKAGAVLVFDIEILEIIGRPESVVPSNNP